MQFYVNPDSQAKTAVAASTPAQATVLSKIADQPTATWLGSWSGDITTAASQLVTSAAAAGQTPVMVAYNIPLRDNSGKYSAGGVDDPAAYRTWISGLSKGIGSSSAVVVLEPDALADMSSLTPSQQTDRMGMLSDAVTTLKTNNPNAKVYLDAGHSGWVPAPQMAQDLQSAGVAKADGFSLNVSNFQTTASEDAYGEQISGLTGGSHYIVDTSRNGNGPPADGSFANPPGRALGVAPTTNTGAAHADAYLWLKAPGESDGPVNGGPAAGQWFQDYALGLASAVPTAE